MNGWKQQQLKSMKDPHLHDVYLIGSDGKEIGCSKTVLALQSSVFKSLFFPGTCVSTNKYKYDFHSVVIQVLVNFCYCGDPAIAVTFSRYGDLNVHESELLVELLEAGRHFQLLELTRATEQQIGIDRFVTSPQCYKAFLNSRQQSKALSYHAFRNSRKQNKAAVSRAPKPRSMKDRFYVSGAGLALDGFYKRLYQYDKIFYQYGYSGIQQCQFFIHYQQSQAKWLLSISVDEEDPKIDDCGDIYPNCILFTVYEAAEHDDLIPPLTGWQRSNATPPDGCDCLGSSCFKPIFVHIDG